MEQEILKLILQSSGAIGSLLVLYLILKQVAVLTGKNHNDEIPKIETRLKKLENESYHYLLGKVDKIDERLDRFESRITRLETLFNHRK